VLFFFQIRVSGFKKYDDPHFAMLTQLYFSDESSIRILKILLISFTGLDIATAELVNHIEGQSVYTSLYPLRLATAVSHRIYMALMMLGRLKYMHLSQTVTIGTEEITGDHQCGFRRNKSSITDHIL
jgi:hypothetical protein